LERVRRQVLDMSSSYALCANASTARIKSNLSIRKLSAEDMKALDSLAIPEDKGRTVNLPESWGVPVFQNSTV
jgi:diketogulonate reductase-like aldo/keto reductase